MGSLGRFVSVRGKIGIMSMWMVMSMRGRGPGCRGSVVVVVKGRFFLGTGEWQRWRDDKCLGAWCPILV